LRFVTALVLGAAVTAIPVAFVGCGSGDDDVPWPDDATAGTDANPDAIDAPAPVDGPLSPPDLARVA
jgi:hypothetical protein